MEHAILNKSWSLGIVFLFIGSTAVAIPQNNIIENISAISESVTFYVGGSGPSNYTSIRDAIDNASDGDTVFVYDDSSPYYENLIIKKTINLIGENQETTIIDGKDQLSVLCVHADGVNISGFTIQNSGILWINHGIDLHSSYNNITENIIKNNYVGIGLYTVSSYESRHNIIKNNVIQENSGNGLYLFNSNYNTISNNIISSNDWNGVYLDESFNNKISANTISNNKGGLILSQSNYNNLLDNIFENDGVSMYGLYQNVFSNNSVNGKPIIFLKDKSDISMEEEAGQIILLSCNRITIKNQKISNVSVGVMLINTHDCLISNNIFNSNDWYGIALTYSNNNNISSNSISDSSIGIAFDKSENNKIYGNTIKSNKRYGIWFLSSNNNIISRNAINNNGGRKLIDNGLGIFLFMSSNNEVSYNNFINNARNAYFNEAENTKWYKNYWSRPRIIPKIIRGESAKLWPFDIKINIDWHPARTPYDI